MKKLFSNTSLTATADGELHRVVGEPVTQQEGSEAMLLDLARHRQPQQQRTQP